MVAHVKTEDLLSSLSAPNTKGGLPKKMSKTISWEELALHKSPSDLWIAIHGVAYDVTEWAKFHPGGWRLLEFYGGMDASEPFLAYHAPSQSKSRATARMPGLAIGNMEARQQTEQQVVFAQMDKAMTDAGMYKPNHGNYYFLYTYLVSLFALIWYLVIHRHIVLASIAIGCFWGQLSFVGHDSGHRSAHITRKSEDWLGVIVNAFLGIGLSHWVDNHNSHHGPVNSSDCDPEVQFMPFIATSTLHFDHTQPKLMQPKTVQRQLSLISRMLVSYQHYSFIPLLLFARYKFYVQALAHFNSRKIYVHRNAEFAAQLFFFAWFALLTAQLPTWTERIAWIVLSHAADWILFLQTVITHFPRDIRPGVQTEWIEAQSVGTLNWSCPAWMDWYHGGLHFQIEHHLFPRICRHNLRRASAILRPMVEELGVDYHIPTFFGAIAETFDSLKEVAMEARKPIRADCGGADGKFPMQPVASATPAVVSAPVTMCSESKLRRLSVVAALGA
eukprot:gene414-1809_t